MGETTNIEWCDANLDLWWKISGISEVKTWRSTLARISRRAKVVGRRLRVVCQPMSEMFEGPEAMGGFGSENWKLVSRLQDELFEVIAEHPELDFLLLTKRPENVLGVAYRHDDCDTPGYNWTWPDNLWIGTSVEDQKTADERIPELLKIPAAVRFLSCEPLLGWVDLTRTIWPVSTARGAPTVQGFLPDKNEPDDWRYWIKRYGIHWVICGGESGPNARPMHPDWAMSLRDQCEAANVPFYFNGWGEWAPDESLDPNGAHLKVISSDREYLNSQGSWEPVYQSPSARVMNRVGKARAGQLLDGREWSEFPEVNP